MKSLQKEIEHKYKVLKDFCLLSKLTKEDKNQIDSVKSSTELDRVVRDIIMKYL